MTKDKGKVVNLKTNKKRFKKRRFFLTLGIIYLLVFFSYQAFQILSLKKQEEIQSQKLEELTKLKLEYQQELEQVSSPDYIEKIARENLKMIKPGEILYVHQKKEENEDSEVQEEE